jgi:hypothetical protein
MKINCVYENIYTKLKIVVYKSLQTNEGKTDYLSRYLTATKYRPIGYIERITQSSLNKWGYIGPIEDYPEYFI